jgi:hypothetical protein
MAAIIDQHEILIALTVAFAICIFMILVYMAFAKRGRERVHEPLELRAPNPITFRTKLEDR